MTKLTTKERIGLAKVYEQLEYRISIKNKMPKSNSMVIMVESEYAESAKTAIEKVLGISDENN